MMKANKKQGAFLSFVVGILLCQGCALNDEVATNENLKIGTVSAMQALNLMCSAVGIDPSTMQTAFDEAKYNYAGVMSAAIIQAHSTLAGRVMAEVIRLELAKAAGDRVIFKDISLSGGWRTVSDSDVETLVNRLAFRVKGELPSPETISILVQTFNDMKTEFPNNNSDRQRDLFKAIGSLILGQASTLLG